MVTNENSKTKIISIASGKGGVGKSVISANLGISLAQEGARTVVIDLSLGNSNLHSFLGLKNINPGIGNYLVSKRYDFNDIVFPTEFNGLWFVPGDVFVVGTADIQTSQKSRLINDILKLNVDYVILDLGPGSSRSIIDFFLISNSGFLVVTPVTTSLLSSFSFLKNTIMHMILDAFSKNTKVSSYLKRIIKENKPGDFPTMEEILLNIKKADSKSYKKLKKILSTLQPKMILNNANTPDDIYNAKKLEELIYDNLMINIECMGLIFKDEAVDESLEDLVPIMKNNTDSIFAKEVHRIALKIVQSPEFPKMPLDLEYYEDSYELAKIEAENDYQEIFSSQPIENKFDMEELMTVIKDQKRQINELRGTIRMLTLKNEF